jgi:hypothetical protein
MWGTRIRDDVTRTLRIFIPTLALAGLIALAFGYALQPEKPHLSGDGGYREQAGTYNAGGASCEPAQIETLPSGVRERKAEACADAKEQHRTATNGVIEARRAADAADASAVAAYDQARIAAWGMGVGIVTLIAAVFAAAFAASASHHTRRGADAAHDANRPWLEVEIAGQGPLISANGDLSMRIELLLTNHGRSPATNVLPEVVVVAQKGQYATIVGWAIRAIRDKFLMSSVLGRETGYTIFPGGDRNFPLRAEITLGELVKQAHGADAAYLSRAVGARYRFGDKFGETAVAFDMVPKRVPIYGTDDKRIPIGADKGPPSITLEDDSTGYAT